MQADDAGQGAGAENGDGVDGGPAARFRLPPRVLLAALVGLLFLIAASVGAWMYFSQAQKKESAARAKAAAQAKAKKAAEPSPEAVAENQAQLDAARKAHADIMAGNALGAGEVKAILVPPVEGGSRSVVAPTPAAAPTPAPVPPAPAAALPAKPVEPVAAASAPSPAPGSTGKDAEQSAAANAESPIGPGGCMVSGANPQDYGAALGRCLEEFNRMEAAVNEAAKSDAAKAGGSRPRR